MSCSRFGLVVAACIFFTGCATTTASTSLAKTAPQATFPRDNAQHALSAARPGLRACRRNAHATPVIFEATLEFEPSGRVGRVLIAPAGPVADCVRSDLAQVEIPSFDGPPMEVEMQLTL